MYNMKTDIATWSLPKWQLVSLLRFASLFYVFHVLGIYSYRCAMFGVVCSLRYIVDIFRTSHDPRNFRLVAYNLFSMAICASKESFYHVSWLKTPISYNYDLRMSTTPKGYLLNIN